MNGRNSNRNIDKLYFLRVVAFVEVLVLIRSSIQEINRWVAGEPRRLDWEGEVHLEALVLGQIDDLGHFNGHLRSFIEAVAGEDLQARLANKSLGVVNSSSLQVF